MKIYNSLSKKIELFVPGTDKTVRMYLCGPTVYDLPHLGHGRSAVNFDFIRKYLIYKGAKEGFSVQFASNYTDIDDKMINRAAEQKISVKALSERIIPEYLADYTALDVMPPDFSPKATDHIQEMIVMVKKLADEDVAYKLDDGWYFDIKKFKKYGELSGQNLDDLKAGARVDLVEGKRNPQDFVLWKFKKEGEPSWNDDLLGEGRPGWHIECSAMIHDVFGGKMIDIHGGGEDLRFPHHECEIAQSESTYGENTFVRFWVHNAFVLVKNEKMSKSLNNFTTLRELFKTVDPMVLRFFYLQHHYRSPIDFHDAALEQAKNGLSRLHNFYNDINLREDFSDVDTEFVENGLANLDAQIEDELNNDFETGKAITTIFGSIALLSEEFERNYSAGLVTDVDLSKIKIRQLSKKDRKLILDFWKKWNAVFGFLIPKKEAVLVSSGLTEYNQIELEGRIAKYNKDTDWRWLVESRLAARAQKNFAASDQIRDFLKEHGVLLEDSKNGTIVKFV